MARNRNNRILSFIPSVLIVAILLAGAALPHSPRAFQGTVFAAMLVALWRTGSRVSLWLVPEFEPLSRVVAAFAFAVGIAIVPATWMGHFGLLRPMPFLAWSMIAYLLTRLLPAEKARAQLSIASTSEPARANQKAIRSRIETTLLLAAALAITLASLHEARSMRYLPPGHYDDVSYHLSTVATWIRHGDLRMIRFSMGDASTPFYPVLGEMASWVLIAPFRDSDVAARWTQLPFACFSFLATAAIARRLGLSFRSSALAAISYAGIHHVLPYLAMGAGNDHATSFFTLAAVDGSLAFARRPRPGVAVVTGAALGLLLATKYIGVLFAPVVLAVLLLGLLAERRHKEEVSAPARRLAGPVILLAATMAITGGYTYLRNAVTTGNPIFPASVQVFGVKIFPGWVDIAERSTYPESHIDVWHFLTRRSRHFGTYFPFTLLPAAVLAPLLALGRRRWREALVFSLPVVFFLQFLLLMHDHRDIRYFLPGIALAAVAFAWLLAQIGRWGFPVRAALLAWIAWQAIRQFKGGSDERILTTLAVLGMAVFLESGWRRWQDRAAPCPTWIGRWGWTLAAGLLALAAMPLGRTVATYQKVKLAKQPGPLALERLAGPDGARVAYAGFNKPYLFFGSRLQNDLEIVPRSRALAARTYRWGGRLEEPYAVGPYRRWHGNLERLGIELVVIIRSRWEDPERQWMVRRTRDFRLLYQDMETEIWQVRQRPEAARKRGAADRPGHRQRGPGRAPRPGAGNGSNSS